MPSSLVSLNSAGARRLRLERKPSIRDAKLLQLLASRYELQVAFS
jgi:hypothetical protein